MSIYKRDIDKVKCMYFLIKDLYFFDKCNETLEKVSHTVNKRRTYTYHPNVFLEKYNFDNDIEVYSNNSYCVDFDEECYDEKCIDLFLKI